MKNLPRKLGTLTADANDPARKGQQASKRVTFGQFARYCIYAVHTRFDAVQWFVQDAHGVDEITHGVDEITHGPAIIRQEDSKEAALRGLV